MHYHRTGEATVRCHKIGEKLRCPRPRKAGGWTEMPKNKNMVQNASANIKDVHPSSKARKTMERRLLFSTLLFAILGTSVYNVRLYRQLPSFPGIINARQFVHLVQEGKRKSSDLCQGKGGETETRCPPDPCLPDAFIVWEEWKACKQRQIHTLNWKTKDIDIIQELGTNVTASKMKISSGSRIAKHPKPIARKSAIHRSPVRVTTPFEEFIVENRHQLPWSMESNFTAVLVEFRALRQPLRFSINNALNHLPVSWRIQIVGGRFILSLAQRIFPVEIAVGKIVLTHAGREKMKQGTISEVFTDPSFYEKLLGHTWLFFQYDSVICSQQRWRLRDFLEKDSGRGWWGAPWRNLRVGGNGGFSLRKKEFISTILSRFSWNGDPEDWFFCEKAAHIYHELPDGLKPASQREGMKFSSEMMYSDHPFGVHKFWVFHSPADARMKKMMNTCPEMLGILPWRVMRNNSTWEKLVCSLNITRDVVEMATSGGTFDYGKFCPFESSINVVNQATIGK